MDKSKKTNDKRIWESTGTRNRKIGKTDMSWRKKILVLGNAWGIERKASKQDTVDCNLKESRQRNKIDEECKETEARRIFEKGRERKASRLERQVFEKRIKNERQEERAWEKEKEKGASPQQQEGKISENQAKKKTYLDRARLWRMREWCPRHWDPCGRRRRDRSL
jgi:hypothetical protein